MPGFVAGQRVVLVLVLVQVLVLVLIGTPSCGRKSEKVRQEDGEQKVRR